ncbi:MAG: PAS domain S-box protein [Methanospirillum sp.]
MVFVGSTVPKISLLYVDDEPELLTIGKLFLEREGEFVVTTAPGAPEAIGLLSRQSYDAIVSDYQMPGMDGIALLKHLKAAGNTTPFIIFTGKGREEVVIEALNEGADFYLQKGGNPMAQFAELSNKIRYAVNRKRTEESLRTSEERYRNLIETSHEAIVVAQDGMLRRVNRRAMEASGYSEEELLSMPFLTLIHPDDREMVADRYRKRISGEEAPLPRYAVRLIRRDGSIEIVEIDGVEIDWEGSPATLNFMTDITARRRAEDAAEASEARYRALFAKIRSGVAIYEAIDDGSDFVIRDINPAVEVIESVRREDVVGRRVSEVFPGVGDFGLLPVLGRVWRTGQSEHHPVSIYRDDRIEGWRETIVYRLPQGEVVSVFDGETHQKQAGEVLERSEEHRVDIDNWPEGIFILDASGAFLDANPFACSRLGYSRDELLSRSLRDITSAGTMDGSPADLLENGPEMREAVLVTRDGDSLPVILNAVRLPDERRLVYCTDISERKRAEDALRERESQLQAILRGSPIPNFVIDRDHRVISWNRALEDLTGIDARDVLGTNEHWCAFYPHERPCLADVLMAEAIGEDPVVGVGPYTRSTVVDEGYEATAFIPALGENGKWLNYSAALIRDANGRAIGALETLEDFTAMKEAEQSLRESEQRYYNIIEDQTEFVCRFRPDGTHAFVNKAYADYFGTTRDALIGHVFRPTIHPDDLKRVRQFFASLTPDHPVDLIEQRTVTADGDVRWQRWSDRAIFDTTGAVVEYQSVGRDVTLQKVAGAALVDSESFNRGLVESLPDYIVVCTHDGEILFVNPAIARAFDCRAEDFVGTHLLSHIAEEHRSRAASSMAARREGREIPPYETDILLRDGSRRSVIVKGAQIQYRNSPALLLVLSDITERKRAEETQHQLSEFQKSVITNAQVWLSVFDRTGKVLIWNRAAEEISGYGPDEVLGKNEIWEMFYPDEEYLHRTLDTIQRTVRNGKSVENLETAIQSRQGEKKVISWNVSGLPGATGDMSQYIAIGVDVTDRHLAEEALRQANKQVNLLSSITRHDILNQLMVLKGYLQFSLDVLDDKKTLADFLERELRAADLIEEQIMFTRDYQEMGANAPEWQNVSASVARARAQLSMHGIEISVDRSDLEIFVDPLFERVFYNLFDNALRHGGDGMATIRISTRASGQSRIIVYEDDGVGVSPEDRAHLFKRGFGKNTGLGLFLSREILGITGISITENGEPGKGARFEIAVPEGAWRFAGTDAQDESEFRPASGTDRTLSDGIR